jgi:hypothetical protein
LQRRAESAMEAMLGIRLVASEYPTGPWHRGRIDTLGLDENGAPVVIEYKKGADGGIWPRRWPTYGGCARRGTSSRRWCGSGWVPGRRGRPAGGGRGHLVGVREARRHRPRDTPHHAEPRGRSGVGGVQRPGGAAAIRWTGGSFRPHDCATPTKLSRSSEHRAALATRVQRLYRSGRTSAAHPVQRPPVRPRRGCAEAAGKQKAQVSEYLTWALGEPPSGFEPETYALRVRCSGQLS